MYSLPEKRWIVAKVQELKDSLGSTREAIRFLDISAGSYYTWLHTSSFGNVDIPEYYRCSIQSCGKEATETSKRGGLRARTCRTHLDKDKGFRSSQATRDSQRLRLTKCKDCGVVTIEESDISCEVCKVLAEEGYSPEDIKVWWKTEL